MTVGGDPKAAVAALAAAKDIEALEGAIAQAAFLDSTPGDDRQKLRGAQRREALVCGRWPSRRRARCERAAAPAPS